MTIAPIITALKVVISKPFIIVDGNQKKKKFNNIENKPNVIIVIGRVRILITGRTIMSIKTRIAPTINATHHGFTLISGKKYARPYITADNNIH